MAARILITRAEDDALDTAKSVQALGFEPVIDSILRVYPETWAEPDWAKVAALIVTSHNALRGFEGHGIPRDKLFFLVGGRTQKELRQRGYIHVTGTVEKSDDIAFPIRMQLHPEDGVLIHLGSEHSLSGFYEPLKREGFKIETRHVYRAEEAKQLQDGTVSLLQTAGITAALFYSARTVSIFEGLAKSHNAADALKNVQALCLSDNVAAACDKTLWKSVQAAISPTHDSLMDCLAKTVPANP